MKVAAGRDASVKVGGDVVEGDKVTLEAELDATLSAPEATPKAPLRSRLSSAIGVAQTTKFLATNWEKVASWLRGLVA